MIASQNLDHLAETERISPLLNSDLNHTHIDVANYERALNFYKQHFGFFPVFETPPSEPRNIRFVRNSHGFTLGLELAAEGKLPKWFHFGFKLHSPEAVIEAKDYFESTSVPVLAVAGDRDEGYVTFVVLDPDGHHLEIFWEAD